MKIIVPEGSTTTLREVPIMGIIYNNTRGVAYFEAGGGGVFRIGNCNEWIWKHEEYDNFQDIINNNPMEDWHYYKQFGDFKEAIRNREII